MTARPVLYVEDEENDVLLLQMSWGKSGMEHPLKFVCDGQEAIEYLAGTGAFANRTDHPLPCLVLLDLNLPRKSGFEVLEWIRAQSENRSLPVIIYTSSDHAPDRERAAALGANGYFVKPTLPPQIIELLKDIRQRWLTS